MKPFFLVLITLIPVFALSQTTSKIANEAFVVTRMVAKFHVAPRSLNDSFSTDVYNQMLIKADEGKEFFTKDDIAKFSAFRTLIDDEIKQKNTDFLTLFTNTYLQRLKQVDSLASVVCAKPFNITLAEKLTVTEDTSFPANTAAAQLKLYKLFKMGVLSEIADDLPDDYKSLTTVLQKKYLDSAEAAFRKKRLASFKRKINNILQNPYGMAQYMGNMYCETIALCFDPHTEYLPKTKKENFESELGQQPFRFGFTMEEDKDGGVIISNLKPGSPAFKCGKLNKGDKFITVQWAGKQPVDVSNTTPDELSSLISQSNHDTIYFTMRKSGGTIVQVPLLKEQAKQDVSEDDNKVKSFILKGSSAIGYIYLPAFYEDWETGDNGNAGCANDVAKEIVKLKRENINGLIIDLRYNGGGSVDEARQLAGIFIDAGPVAQEKGREPKPFTLKDIDRGTIFDGPLVLLVNGYSASASELLAGTLQNYNRAVIIGTPTYGKATAQVILPMDTTVTYETFAKKQTENYIKITINKLYRVNGTTAQFAGVQPDILLPDMLDAHITKESDEALALKPDVIDANKYFQPYPALPVTALAAAVKQEVDTSSYFTEVRNLLAAYKQKNQPKDILLTLNNFITSDDDEENSSTLRDKRFVSKNFTVQNNQYELSILRADSYLNQLNDGFKQIISTDPYINISYDVLSRLKK